MANKETKKKLREAIESGARLVQEETKSRCYSLCRLVQTYSIGPDGCVIIAGDFTPQDYDGRLWRRA